MLKNLFLGASLGNFVFFFVLFCTLPIFWQLYFTITIIRNFHFSTRWDHRNKNKWQNRHVTLRYLLSLNLNEAIGPLFTYPLMPKENYLNEDLELININKYSSLYTIMIEKLHQLSSFVVICFRLECVNWGWIWALPWYVHETLHIYISQQIFYLLTSVSPIRFSVHRKWWTLIHALNTCLLTTYYIIDSVLGPGDRMVGGGQGRKL